MCTASSRPVRDVKSVDRHADESALSCNECRALAAENHRLRRYLQSSLEAMKAASGALAKAELDGARALDLGK